MTTRNVADIMDNTKSVFRLVCSDCEAKGGLFFAWGYMKLPEFPGDPSYICEDCLGKVPMVGRPDGTAI